MMSVKYLDVMSGAVKPKVYGRMTVLQYVDWDDVPVTGDLVQFLTLGSIFVRTPPSLPDGFRMKVLPAWLGWRDRILEGWETATFQELDQKMLDLETLADVTIIDWAGDDFIPYHERPDWVDWAMRFDDAWSELPDQVDALFEAAVPHMPPYVGRGLLIDHIAKEGLDCQPIGNRVMPPSLVDVLELMLAKAKENCDE